MPNCRRSWRKVFTKKSPGMWCLCILLHASGYKSLLVSTEPSQNYEEDLHVRVFECAEAERETGYYFRRAAQKNFVKIGILKKN